MASELGPGTAKYYMFVRCRETSSCLLVLLDDETLRALYYECCYMGEHKVYRGVGAVLKAFSAIALLGLPLVRLF